MHTRLDTAITDEAAYSNDFSSICLVFLFLHPLQVREARGVEEFA